MLWHKNILRERNKTIDNPVAHMHLAIATGDMPRNSSGETALKISAAATALVAGLVISGAAFANHLVVPSAVPASGHIAQIHDGNLRFCIRIGDAWYYAPKKQDSLLAAGVSGSMVSFMYNPAEKVKCHANPDGSGGVDAFTITNDVDLLFE
jgi:hypothetical protein